MQGCSYDTCSIGQALCSNVSAYLSMESFFTQSAENISSHILVRSEPRWGSGDTCRGCSVPVDRTNPALWGGSGC